MHMLTWIRPELTSNDSDATNPPATLALDLTNLGEGSESFEAMIPTMHTPFEDLGEPKASCIRVQIVKDLVHLINESYHKSAVSLPVQSVAARPKGNHPHLLYRRRVKTLSRVDEIENDHT